MSRIEKRTNLAADFGGSKLPVFLISKNLNYSSRQFLLYLAFIKPFDNLALTRRSFEARSCFLKQRYHVSFRLATTPLMQNTSCGLTGKRTKCHSRVELSSLRGPHALNTSVGPPHVNGSTTRQCQMVACNNFQWPPHKLVPL